MAALIERFGIDTVREAMRETLDYAERRTRARIAELEDGVREARDVLEAAEGDLELRLTARVEGDGIELDFAGSAPQHEGNLNCPLAVTRSACYFAVRVLTDPDIPPCAGAYRPITVKAPEGSLLNARSPAAVVAGNVETSSRVADLVLRAFGRALGQGTMNNLTLGNDRFTYYETLGGGQGAVPMPTAPAPCTWRCRTRSTRPSRRSSSSSRCGRWNTRCGELRRRGAPPRRRRRGARAGGARRDALLADHRAPPARAAGR